MIVIYKLEWSNNRQAEQRVQAEITTHSHVRRRYSRDGEAELGGPLLGYGFVAACVGRRLSGLASLACRIYSIILVSK